MRFWGVETGPEKISRAIFSSGARGTLTLDMELYPARAGLRSLQYSGNFEDLKEKIDRGLPLLLMVDYGVGPWQRNHYMVALGYNERGVIVNSGTERMKLVPFNEFAPVWKRTGFWSLLVTP